ncbi:MAG: DUF1192 domain-containing protein [Alphaproteobacteria bacterium]|tara:strand:+ start:281 stop:469 length:189 start_codon:yes stop_codon:yes gene_type:complete
MNEDEINIPKKDFNIGDNLDALSLDELTNYISVLENEIIRVKGVKLKKNQALEAAKIYFKTE